jgi:hypothetical protein
MTAIQRPATATASDAQRFQCSLASLMLIVALIALPLGLARQAVVLGILFSAAAVPAVVRTWKAVAQARVGDRRDASLGLVKIFLNSLAIIALIAAISLAMLLSYMLVASLLVVIAATSLCRVSTEPLARFCVAVRWLLRQVICGTVYLVTLHRRPLRRVRTMINRVPSYFSRMLGTCLGGCLTAGLIVVVGIISFVRFFTERLARIGDVARWLLIPVKRGLRRCNTANLELLRRFGAIERLA